MAGLLGSLHSAKSGMTVSQTSIQTTSHNINNMNTPGYTRQRVEQSAKSAYSNPGFNSSLGAGQLGTGVEATDIIRIRNTFYDYQYRSESHNYGEISTKYEYYTNMETIFNEPSETSISASIANFFSSWQELSKNPTDVGSKDIMVQNTKYLADNISNIKKKLDSLSEQANKKLNEDVEEVNDMLEQLKELDKQIKIVEGSGKTPNDLMDERDKVIDDLSMKLNLTNDDVKQLLDSTYDAGGNFTPLTVDDIKGLDNVSGEIQGSLDMIDKINEYTTSLTELAKGIAEGVNKVLADGGATPSDLFIFDADKNPILSVNKDLSDRPRDFEISTETALAMYKLKDEKITIGGETTTIDKFYNQIIQKLGNESQEIIRQESNQSKIIKEIDNTRLNTSGVSLDEEMVNLIQFQHAYNASAKVVSTIDSLLDVVINGLKR
ncbi:flagellar hook-associated protein FlgK [Terrisporobacter vanillatitrophus]|uniref:flagellar hook-associated protein FlgK n=1 Tax=Terrisporobacter vanillatitrophus TaxID=3058402 RepID=UPI0033684715